MEPISAQIYIIVPEGFITDGASCPNILASLCTPMGGPHAEAAVLHDYLYSLDSHYGFSRDMVDKIFLKGMLSDKTGWCRAHAIYSGVRAGGWASYRSCHSRDKLDKSILNPKDWGK